MSLPRSQIPPPAHAWCYFGPAAASLLLSCFFVGFRGRQSFRVGIPPPVVSFANDSSDVLSVYDASLGLTHGYLPVRPIVPCRLFTLSQGYAPSFVFSTDTSSRALADDDGTCPVNQRLVPVDGEEWDYFGVAADVDGDYLIVGAPWHDVDDITWAGTAAGKAYIYRRDEVGLWAQPYTLVLDSPSIGDWFGWCVAISGDRALVGAQGDDDAGPNAGSVHVFVRVDDTSNMWSRETVLTPPSGSFMFGASCALDGNTAVVGAPYWTDNNKGSAYIFERDEANGWSEPQELRANDEREDDDYFGRDVAVRGKTAIVGAYGDDKGSAYIFVRDATGSWMEEKKLTAGDGREGDGFGRSVGIQENVAIVGAPWRAGDYGAAYLFVDGRNGWEERRIVTEDDVGDAGAPRRIGFPVAIDGDNIIVGAWRDYTAHLLRIGDDDELTLVTRLVFEEATPDTGGISAAAISGSTIVMGSRWHRNDDGVRTGGVKTFESCDGPTVSSAGKITCLANNKLVPDDLRNDDVFGDSLDIDGDHLIVGASLHDVDDIRYAGKAYVYRRDRAGRWAQPYTFVHDSPSRSDYFGLCVAVSGDRALVGSPGDSTVHVFVRVHGTFNAWSRETVLAPPAGGEWFGRSCALDGGTAVVGEYYNGNSRGYAFVFERDETHGWSEPKKLTPSDATKNSERFGLDVAVRGKTAIVGSQGDASRRGSAYVFVRSATGWWIEDARLTVNDGRDYNNFGAAVAIQENTAMVGDPRSDDGTVYLFVNGQNGWEEKMNVTGHDVEGFGTAVAIDGDKAVVGSTGITAHLLRIDNQDELAMVTRLVAEEAAPYSDFGRSVGISGTTVAVGASRDENDDGAWTGAVHTFGPCRI